MKKILETLSINNKTIKRLYVNQFVMAIFSIMVLFASAPKEADGDTTLLWMASFLSIAIYMFLTYNLMWETGARKAMKSMSKPPQSETLREALTLIFTGSLLNIIGAIAYLIAKIYVTAANITTNATDNIGVFVGNIVWTVIRFIHAMYWGIESLLFPNPNVGLPVEEAVEFAPLLTPPYYFFLTLLPVIIVGTCAYMLGSAEFSILKKMGIDIKPQLNTEINYRNKKK